MNIDFRLRGAKPVKKVVLILTIAMMCCYVVLIIYPLFNMVMSSFKSTRAIMKEPFALPESISFESYKVVWVDKGFYRYFLNSIIVTGTAMVLVILFGTMASYGISRYKFKGNNLLFVLFLSGIMLPLKAAIIPLYMIIRNLGLSNNLLAIICINIAMGLPSTVFIVSGFMRGIPIDMEYAARIDGCNDLRIYWQIAIPIVAPGIAIATIYNAVPIWNEFFFPLVFLQNDKLRTLPVGLNTFIGQYKTDWGLMFTGLTISIIPMLVLYLAMSKQFIRGMTSGALK